MRKIINNYSIVDDKTNEKKEHSHHPTNPVIKIPVYQEKEKQIDSNNLQTKLKEPKLQLTRNNEGVVVGIEVQCVCGEKILIKLDYK